ncbi:MAG: lipoprotein-releasing ABC transporter permease subunit [Rickettsiales bacterium]|jgi:lipoprotein-releasing system permease protein|nr:lipoprotein-releasing ABC transporter permease subunit [Rickettsiales bacterium]
MIKKVEYFIAWRYLKSKKQERFISVVALFSLVGTALGVAALIAVMSVMSGVRTEWTNKLIGAVGDINIYPKLSSEINAYQAVVKNVTQNPHVIHAIPVIEKQVLVSANNNNSGVQIRGIEEKDLQKKSLVADNIIIGSLNDMPDDGIVIGSTLANTLKVNLGDSVKIISPQTNDVFISNIPRFKTCKVSAIFYSGMHDFDSSVVFIGMELAQIYFKMPNQVNLIEITMLNAEDSDLLSKVLDKKLKYQYILIDWKQRNSAIIGALQTEKVAMFMILTLIMVVAAFNIISSLIMLVKDKTSDIAILRTMGASKNSIMRIFFICGASIGVLGTFIGVILGVSFAKNIDSIRLFLQKITGTAIFDPLVYFLSYLPAKVNIGDVVTITGMSLTLSFLATIYPAYRAAKLNPATALKYK